MVRSRTTLKARTGVLAGAAREQIDPGEGEQAPLGHGSDSGLIDRLAESRVGAQAAVIGDREAGFEPGIAKRVAQPEWEAVCQAMETAFRERRYEQGSIEAIERVTLLLARHFPAEGVNANELPDKPRLL